MLRVQGKVEDDAIPSLPPASVPFKEASIHSLTTPLSYRNANMLSFVPRMAGYEFLNVKNLSFIYHVPVVCHNNSRPIVREAPAYFSHFQVLQRLGIEMRFQFSLLQFLMEILSVFFYYFRLESG